MSNLQEIQYRTTLLSDGLQGLGLSMAVHHTGEDQAITRKHALRLAHLVECCGFVAQQLSEDLENEMMKEGKA